MAATLELLREAWLAHSLHLPSSAVIYWNTMYGQLARDKLGSRSDRKRPRDGAEMTTLEAREATQPLAGEQLKSRVALVTGGTRGVGTALGRSLAGRLGRRDGVARVVHFLCAGASSCVTGRVWALNGSQEM